MRFGRRRAGVDQRRVLQEFGRALALIVDEAELHQTVTAQLRSALGLARVLLLLRDGEGEGGYRVASARGVEEGEVAGLGSGASPAGPAETAGLRFAASGRLVRWLRVNEEPLVLRESPGVVEFLDPEERAALERLGIAACFPLVTMNQLTGFLLLAPGREANGPSGPPWPAPAERELLQALAGQAALACENVALLQEQRLRLKRMYRAERLATAGELAAGAAHEIRNPLAAIRSAIQYVRADYPEGSERSELMADLLGEVDRIDEIVEGLLSFARPEAPAFETVDLAELLRHGLALVDARARRQRVRTSLDAPAELLLEADADQLRQVLLNVVLNALQAMPDGGELHVGARRSGHGVEVRVRDTGPGIPAEQRERIFDPFFTTKKGGTGLGLSICYGIVQRHGGQIEAICPADSGTEIVMRFPERQRS